MPLFEGLSFTGERSVVVLDIGHAYTKCGLAGETGPRCIIPSQVKCSRSGKVCQIWEFEDGEQLYENLKDFLFVLYFRHLLVNSKDRRVVVCESLMCPTVFRETLARVLFKHYEVSSVLFAPNHVVPLLTLGVNTGLVIDVGYSEALIVPVYDGITIMKGWQAAPRGGKAIHKRIKENLLDSGMCTTSKGEPKPISSIAESLTEEVLEDIKVRCCFITSFSRAQLIRDVLVKGADSNTLPNPPPDVQYPLEGNLKLNVTGSTREHSCEVLFERDNDQISIATLILDSLIKCPVDTRKELCENVVVTGGTAMCQGFYHRLKCELDHLLKTPPYNTELAVKGFRFYQPPSKENYTAWLGGAILGSLETLPMKSVTRDVYLKTNKLPDWCTLNVESETDLESREVSVERKVNA